MADSLAIIHRDIDDLRNFEVQSTLAALGELADGRGYNLPRHEFGPNTPHVRNAIRPHIGREHSARFNSLDLFNRSFYRANITEEDLASGSLVVTARFMDFHTGRVILYPLELTVPRGSRYNTVLFSTLFENYCDQSEAVPTYPHGKKMGSQITHDMRVFCRRDFLNSATKFITMRLAETMEMFQYTGFYMHEQREAGNNISSYGFDLEKALMLYAFKVRSVLNSHRGQRTPCTLPSFVVPSEHAADPHAVLNAFINTFRLFGDQANRHRLVHFERHGRRFAALQLRPDPEIWSVDCLDLLLFIAAYAHLSMDTHSFLGNDEFAALLFLAIHWSCAAVSERRVCLADGFYGRLNQYFAVTGFMPRRRAPVRVRGVEYAGFAYDAFQQPRMCPLLPRGIADLFYGPQLLRAYEYRLPLNGRMAVIPAPRERGDEFLARLLAARAEL